jgi:hypothetical protein
MTLAPGDPFDTTLPSPISAVIELRPAGSASVVRAERLTPVQERALVETGLEARIRATVTGDDPPALVVISGSAGGGKSAAINRLTSGGDAFGAVIEDATHAEAPDQEQCQRLTTFFAPLRDGEPPFTGKPLLIAMNTGMVVRFFDQLRAHRGLDHGFTALEAALREQLQLPSRAAAAELPGPVLVVNLDLRATAGGADSLFARMLEALDPDRPRGVMGGAARCATCKVRGFCFVRTNAEIASADPARTVLDRAAEEIALDRGRPLQPRELWALGAELVTGGAHFTETDPCWDIARLSAEPDGRLTVWDRLIPNGAFTGTGGEISRRLRGLDPSYRPGDRAHELMTAAGIDPAGDAGQLEMVLGAPSGREAVQTAASALAERAVVHDGEYDRIAVGRCLVRAAALAGEIDLAAQDDDGFRAALAEYGDPGSEATDALKALQEEIALAMSRAFGVEAGPDTYFYTRAYDARHAHAILVRADLLMDDDLLRLRHPDPVRQASAAGADVAGYRPVAIGFELAGVPLSVDLPLYRLIRSTATGTKPSSADLERFFHLRRAAEALGRKAVDERDRPLLIVQRESGRLFRLARRRDVRGNPTLGIQEVT